MRITACVATKNRTHILHQLLWSLIRQEYTEWDLVIVDDSDIPVQWKGLGIYPRLFSEIARTGHDIRIVGGPRAGRIGAAYQIGLRAGDRRNSLFLRVDDDSWLEPDYLSQLAPVMANDQVGACGRLFLHPGQEIETLEPGDERYRHASIDGLSDQLNIQWYRHSRTDLIPVEHLTANILFSRKWLEKINGFEAKLYRQHRDETQASWRLNVEGARLYVNPSATAWHLKAGDGGARGNSPEVYLDDHRRFMAQRKTMKPGIHINLGHGMGDGFMATPMLQAMRRMNPDRNIAVCAPWAASILEGNPDVNEIAAYPLDAQRTIRLDESVYAWAGAVKWNGHLAEAYCKMFDLPEPEDVTPRLFLNTENNEPSTKSIHIQPYIVVAPWSSAQTFDFFQVGGNKNWPLDRWAGVISWAHENGMAVVQLRGTSEEPLLAGVDRDFCGKPLKETFECISKAVMVISVDTMAHHAAAALGVPSVVLWGRSKACHFGYVKSHIINIQGECPGITVRQGFKQDGRADSLVDDVLEERPCIGNDQWSMDKQVCPIEGHPCMAGIPTQRVIEAMVKLTSKS